MQTSFSTKIPKFEHYGLITSDSLNLISFNLIDYINAKYTSSSDGVVTGFEIKYIGDENTFLIKKGLIKINKKIFWLNSDLKIGLPTDEGRYKCIVDVKCNNTELYFSNDISLTLVKSDEQVENEFLLFEVILRHGAQIRDETNYFEEFRDEFNAISLINQKYSASNSEFSTLSPIILKKWAYTSSQKLRLENIDLNFIFLCLNSIVKKELLIAYLENKLGISININEITNSEIIKKLASILKGNMKKEKKEKEDYEESFYLE